MEAGTEVLECAKLTNTSFYPVLSEHLSEATTPSVAAEESMFSKITTYILPSEEQSSPALCDKKSSLLKLIDTQALVAAAFAYLLPNVEVRPQLLDIAKELGNEFEIFLSIQDEPFDRLSEADILIRAAECSDPSEVWLLLLELHFGTKKPGKYR